MRRKSIEEVRLELERLRQQEASWIEARKREIGVLAERAGALELGDEALLGALLTAAEDSAAAHRFHERGAECAKPRRQRRPASRRASASRTPAIDAGASSAAGA